MKNTRPISPVMIRTRRSDTLDAPRLTRDPDRVASTPEHEGQGEVEDHDGDDAETNGPAHGNPHALGAAGCIKAVVAVDEGHGHGEHARLGQAVDDVDEGQVQVEIMVVDAL